MADSMTATDSEQHQATQFVNEACEHTDVLGSYMPNMYAIPQSEIQDVKAYFARPRLMARGSIPFGTTVSLTSHSFLPDMATMATIFPQFFQRLAGAYGIRFKLNYRLAVAATSFHQGLIVMSWQYGKSGLTGPNYARQSNSFTTTNIPHVRLDISETTSVEMSIPFLYPLEFMEIAPTGGKFPNLPYGQLAVTPVLPVISVAGLATPTYDLFCYLTDIELFGVDAVNPASIVLQSGADILSKEVKKSGVISASLSNMAKISGFVARGVPSLAFIAGPAQWALDTASGVAKYFGYAKPIVDKPAEKVYRSNYLGDSHVDEAFPGEVVGLFQGNTTVVSTALGATDVDEMALAFVCQQWSQVCRTSVNATDVHGTAIYSAPVSPSVFWYRTGTTKPFSNIRFPSNSAGLISQSGNTIMPSSLMYISSFFRLWRGDIKFRFTFAKTKLHGGRYMVTFNPYDAYQKDINAFGGVVLGPEIVSTFQQPYSNSMVMDLKDGNVFEFTAQYQSSNPYLNFASACGGISVVCIDPLQATATVTNAVPLLVEVCGAENYELADFAGPYFPIAPSGNIYIQSGDVIVKAATKSLVSESTVGEKIMSVKQMIAVPSYQRVTIPPNVTIRNFIAPWFVNTTYIRSNNGLALPNATNVVFEANVGGMLSKLYAFCKGGTDVHLYPDAPNGNRIRIYQFPNESTAVSTAFSTNLSTRPFVSSAPLVQNTQGLPVHARLPSFQTVVRIPTTAYDEAFNAEYPTVSASTLEPFMSHHYAMNSTNNLAFNTYVDAYRSAADDAALAHYMGPVPLWIPNSTSTIALDSNGAAF